MKKLIAFFCLLSFAAIAQELPYGTNFGMACPSSAPWCQNTAPNGIFIFDFTQQIVPANFTFTRASSANYFNSSGLLVSAATNAPRWDYGIPGSTTFYGLLLEGTATNFILYDRDLTQVADWTATNATVALDQTGIDGTANDASSITATANNATVCQTITQAATNSVFSIYAERISGTGTISISQNGGSTYQTITLTNSWANYAHATTSVLNPVVCIKLATSGDEIAVDATQFENVAFSSDSGATSPILTTTTSVTRAADNLTANSPWYNKLGGSFVYQFRVPATVNAPSSNSNYFTLGSYLITTNNNNLCVPNGSCPGAHPAPFLNRLDYLGLSYQSPAGVFAVVLNGTSYPSNTAALQSAPTTVRLGSCPSWVQKFTYWNYPLTLAQLKQVAP